MKKIVVVLGIVAFAAILWTSLEDFENQRRSGGIVAAAPRYDRSPGKQAERWRLMKRYQTLGMIDEITARGSLPHLHVGPRFFASSEADRRGCVDVVYGFYFDDGLAGAVLLFERGREIGSYSPPLGLRVL